MKVKFDYNYYGLGQLYLDKNLRTHESNIVEFEYPKDEYKEEKNYSLDEVSSLINELLQLKMQDFYILQQKAYHPEISYSEIANKLRVSKQAIHQRINRIKNDVIYCFICRDFTYNRSSKNSIKY
ncbi:MAG: HTH domain-containing protein [bacterium]|nr:HTH domain-containing protein [bacterium]